ncbi:MAG TPA: PEP/pyruvate-binding domain-containing protein, partial [Gaiellales bacterium]|nr:PEP/pyruvate-binding domain-containing protein [Gaiellales bacterium]
MAETRTTVPFEELRADQVELVGGKCANLGELTGAGFPVPPGFAVTTAAYERDDIGAAVGEAYAELGRQVGQSDPPVAVRSSAIAEDMPDASFAGVQDTYLWICGVEAVLDGVRRCWASFHNPEAVAYREAHGITRAGMSVAVQYMVDARVAGVMFTLNPVSGDRSSIAIDASYGLGVSVVGGE